MAPVERVPYDELSLFHENAEEYGIPWDGPPTVRRQAVEVGPDRRLSALVWGDAPPEIVFLHGGAQNAHTWDTVALALDRPLLAVDLPGHGHSDGGQDGALDPASNAQDVAATIRALAPGAAAVVGMSLGGAVAQALALDHPERVTALITQNGNAYEEGIGNVFAPMREYWREPSAKNRSTLRELLQPESIQSQYTQGVTDTSLIAPESYALDAALLARPGNDEIQLDLFLDYRANVALYPRFQEYFRTCRPPLLAAWGRNDPIFLPAGAEAFKRDIPDAEIRLYETGHFALETHAAEIGAAIGAFLDRNIAVTS